MFEYNGNKTFQDRIKLVSEEIRKLYKEISVEDSIKVALLEDPITTDFNSVLYFKRLYNILLVVQNNRMLFNTVFVDLKKQYLDYKDKPDENEYFLDAMVQEINKFVNKERFDFPMLNEFN